MKPWIMICLSLAASAAVASPPQQTAIVARYALGQSGGWDYLTYEAATHRLFVPRSDRVSVVDGDSGRLLGEIGDTPGVHGVALVPALGKGFSSDGKSDTVTIFDLATLRVRQHLPVQGRKPDAILFDSASGHVLAFNGVSNSVSVVDPASETVLGTIALPGNPEFAASDGHGRVYVNLEGAGGLAAIDTIRNEVVSSWSLGNCVEPSGLAFDAAEQLSFSTCQNHRLVVFDVRHGRRVAALPIDGGPDAAAYDAAQKRVYVANGAGTLSIYRVLARNRFKAVATVRTQRGARTLALDAAGRRVFLATAEFGPEPAPSAETPRPRPPMIPGSFVILVAH